jgi:ribosomal protein S21|tara:strand:- start:215 stop:487 length:273 start_codon:yes stop_codon:yes gene_type:complete
MRKNNKTNRPLGFQGYYVDIPEGGDPMRAYRKIKKWIKNDRFLEELKDRQYFQKPSHWKRETAKRKRQVLRKLQRERDDNRFMGVKRKNK